MILKKTCTLINGLVGLMLAFNVAAQETVPAPTTTPEVTTTPVATTVPAAITVTPSSGEFLLSQKFDIALKLSPEVIFAGPLTQPWYDPTTIHAPIQFQAKINGVNATTWLNECLQEHLILPSGERILLCKAQDYSPFVEGNNDLLITIFTGYNVVTANANYNFTKSQRVTQPLPRKFTIQGTSFNTASGAVLALNERVQIRALGSVNVWPANPSFPISTPRGTQVCANPSTCLLPGAPLGALLVKIGTYGRWMTAGESYILIADRPGELIFAVNDKTTSPGFDDNLGNYTVTINKL